MTVTRPTTRSASAETGVLIDGEWQRTRATFPVRDKFTGEVLAELAQAAPEQVAEAVTVASRASRVPLPPADRERILRRAAELVADRAVDLRETYVAETGFTPADADGEIARTAELFRLCSGEAVRVAGEQVPVEATPGSEHRLAFTIRVPVGVVGAIAPFNAPLSTVVHKVGPAIAAGNAVVLKPAEQTPLSALAVARILLDAGLPAGLLQVVCGPGETTGDALVRDSRIRFFTFTGSTAVGRRIKAASGLARLHLELGSNSASIVAADADLDLVARLVRRAGFRKAGQVCTSVQRLLVDRRVADELAERLSRAVAELRAGDPRDPATDVGPLIDAAEARRAGDWVAEAGGAVVGGAVDGAVLRPALVVDPAPGSRLLEHEAFAPVVALVPVDGPDEAARIVDEGPYGLQTGVFTRDLDRAFHLARTLRVGGVIVNDTSSYHADLMPYGGVKDSGLGVEGPRYAVQDMTDPKIIVLNLRRPEDS
ncbi:aldehyde dehydrogenase family protein [Prauserella cavernicola]|uniref:Aldehyde dehydrogenase family protein n=1 Tax=Prauserella cavernicola TaxID=2800127 RepID=A0A934QVS4_9PSEU|nr:aldehyde dehydrogenase family protein [Prauserella cavernicola]MBK1789172.1 aldehyde dehydrogenase family protein [Prauserella cavernicola]